MIQDSLQRRIDKGQALTEQEQADLMELLGKRCRDKTKGMLAARLRWVPDVPNYGIYGRVLITPEVQYIAGQSYPDEIRYVRELLIRNT